MAETPRGRIVGRDRAGVEVFLGIRYATAERFGPPVAIPAWSEPVDASDYGPECPQLKGLLETHLGLFAGSGDMSEDCLFLNVFTPGCDGAQRPVLVWVHGGAFTSGGSTNPWYDGAALARRGDVVVVTLNYRLGSFGFAGRTNCGIADQIAALGWVHEAIAAFGGDPGRVTVFGESAGGTSALCLMAAPSARGLLHQVFALSPSIGQVRDVARADEALRAFTDAAGVSGSTDAAGAAELEALRELSVEQMLAAQEQMLRSPRNGLSGFSPAAGGAMLPQSPVEAVPDSSVPLVLGTTRDELQLFIGLTEVSSAEVRRAFERRFPDPEAALAAYAQARPGAGPAELMAALDTDRTMRVPARELAEARVRASTPTWMYWFTWPSTAFDGRLGSCHSVDIPFIFDNLDQPDVELFTGPGPTVAVADAYSGALLRLAQQGMPGWPEFNLDRRPTMRFDVRSELLHDPEPELRALWAGSAT